MIKMLLFRTQLNWMSTTSYMIFTITLKIFHI